MIFFESNFFLSNLLTEKILKNGEIRLAGARAEFRVILLNENQIAGSYKFNYAPCTEGCPYLIDYFGNLYKAKKTINVVIIVKKSS